MKVSHSNIGSKKKSTPAKSVLADKLNNKEVVVPIVEEPKPIPVKDDGKKHIKWADDLTEIKKFPKAVTKQRISEVREKAKNTLTTCGKSILLKRLSDYPEDFVDTAPSTPRDEVQTAQAPSSAKQTNKRKFTQSKSLAPRRAVTSVIKSKFESEFLSKMHKRYGLLSKISIY